MSDEQIEALRFSAKWAREQWGHVDGDPITTIRCDELDALCDRVEAAEKRAAVADFDVLAEKIQDLHSEAQVAISEREAP